MPDVPILSPAAASLTVERIQVHEGLSWSDLRPGLPAEAIRAELVARVCGKTIHFPDVHYGFCFEALSTVSLKAILQALIALDERTAHAWREGATGLPTHLLELGDDPAERFELFVFDDQHLYGAYHSNRGGSLALDLLVSVQQLLESEDHAARELVAILDGRATSPEGTRCRSSYLESWSRLKRRVRLLENRLGSLFPPFEAPLF